MCDTPGGIVIYVAAAVENATQDVKGDHWAKEGSGGVSNIVLCTRCAHRTEMQKTPLIMIAGAISDWDFSNCVLRK